MRSELPSYLRDVLQLIVAGYTHEAIGRELFISTTTVHTYVKRLKEYFYNEPELQDSNVSPQKVLFLIGKRYFGDGNTYAQATPSDMYSVPIQREEKAIISSSPLPEIVASSPYFVEWFTNDLEATIQVRTQGNPLLAFELSSTLANRLREITEKAPSSNYSQELFKIREQVLFEHLTCCCVVLLPGQVLKAVKPIVNELQHIAKKCGDEALFGLGYYSLADAYYFRKRYGKSIQLITEALKYVKDIDKQLILLRELALDWAYLGNEGKFKEVEGLAKKIIDSDQFDSNSYLHLERACQMYESLGRGRGLLRLPEALERMQEGWNIHAKIESKNEKAPVLVVQLTRSQLEVMLNMGQPERNDMEAVGNRGYSIAKEHGYRRHAQKIDQLLKSSTG